MIPDPTRRPSPSSSTNTLSIEGVPSKPQRLSKATDTQTPPNKSDLVLKPVATVSVGTQTDFESLPIVPVKKSMFTFGDDESSEPSSPECGSPEPYSERGTPEYEVPVEPRPMSECLTIFKSDVSSCIYSTVYSITGMVDVYILAVFA